MAIKQLEESGKNKPLKKVRAGRFQISTWVFRKLFSSGGKDSTIYMEKVIDVERACIQYSTFNKATGQWENQSIWCSIDDLRSLADVVEQLNEEDEEDDSSSPSSSGENKDEGNEERNEVKDFPNRVKKNPNEVNKMIKSKSIRLKKEKEDGLRICVMRFVRNNYEYDLWYRDLAPSIELLNDYKRKRIDWNEYGRRYLEEISEKKELIGELAKLAKEKVITLLCWELDDKYCHRRLLIDEIKKMNEVKGFSQLSGEKSQRGDEDE